MEDLREIEQLQRLLAEAVDQISDVKHKLGLFEKQRYYRLVNELEHSNKLSIELKAGLAQIETSENIPVLISVNHD